MYVVNRNIVRRGVAGTLGDAENSVLSHGTSHAVADGA